MARQDAYKHFDLFADRAKQTFDSLLRGDARAQDLATRYSFCAIKGGAMGGLDKRLVEVFFGQRPFDQVTILDSNDGGFPVPRTTFVSERGACFRYERTDAGFVVCTLYPASTDALRQREDFIFYEVTAASRLTSQRLLRKHWRALISYMECTNIDSAPSLADIIRVGWLRFTRPLSIKGTVQRAEAGTAVKKISGYVLTVGLSGFLLAVVNNYVGSKDVDQLIENQKQATQDAAKARGAMLAQAAHIQTLERQIAQLNVVAQKVSCLCTLPEKKSVKR